MVCVCASFPLILTMEQFLYFISKNIKTRFQLNCRKSNLLRYVATNTVDLNQLQRVRFKPVLLRTCKTQMLQQKQQQIPNKRKQRAKQIT